MEVLVSHSAPFISQKYELFGSHSHIKLTLAFCMHANCEFLGSKCDSPCTLVQCKGGS
jgi:hypothetical protein